MLKWLRKCIALWDRGSGSLVSGYSPPPATEPGILPSARKEEGSSTFTHQGRSRQNGAGTRVVVGEGDTKSWERSEVRAPNPQGPGYAAP